MSRSLRLSRDWIPAGEIDGRPPRNRPCIKLEAEVLIDGPDNIVVVGSDIESKTHAACRPGDLLAIALQYFSIHESRFQILLAEDPSIFQVDVFLQWTEGTPDELAARRKPAGSADLPLTMITNRGVKVWPEGFPETFCTDHWRCRLQNGTVISHADILRLLQRVSALGFDFIKTENLCTFDGKPGYSVGQGQ